MAEVFHWPTGQVLIMGVLNVTPDSFSDGGRFADAERAVAHGRAMIEAGADLLDVGGESTRPGAEPVPVEEELRRVLPVVEKCSVFSIQSPAFAPSTSRFDKLTVASEVEGLRAAAGKSVVISVDTTKAEVAEQALSAGARVVNDISALRFDERMAGVVRAAGAGVILMHMQGTPRTMQQQPRYADVVGEVYDFLDQRIAWAEARGIQRGQIAVDPGIGFGKTVEQNLKLLAQLEQFRSLGCPLVVGPSRKSFIGQVTGQAVTDRAWGTAATVAWAVAHGAGVVRVHDVAAMRDVVRMIEAIRKATTNERESTRMF